MSHPQSTWNDIWSRPFQRLISIGRVVYNRYFLKEISPFLTKDSKYLEIGCGTASLLDTIAPSVGKAVGFDISEVALMNAARSRPNAKSIEWVQGDCFKLPFKDSSFDVVWSQGLHEHFSDPAAIIREELRVCRSGGVVLVGVPYTYSYPLIWYILTRPKLLRRFWPWTDQRFFSIPQLQELVTSLKQDATSHVMPPWILGIAVAVVRK